MRTLIPFNHAAIPICMLSNCIRGFLELTLIELVHALIQLNHTIIMFDLLHDWIELVCSIMNESAVWLNYCVV